MIRRLLDSVLFASFAPAFIEKGGVPKARARLQYSLTPSPVAQRQILVDTSVIYRNDAGTGIQRVVRAILGHLQDSPPPGYVVRPIAATRKTPYVHVDLNMVDSVPDCGAEVHIRPGDVFLGLDFSAHVVPVHRDQLAEWKKLGAALHFVVYDILPLRHPEWFSPKLVKEFRRWIKTVVVLADRIICISGQVDADLADWLKHRYGFDAGTVPTSIIPMGWDLASTKPSRGLPRGFEQVLAEIRARETVLMVGTLEPRKGHADILKAFEELWSRGENYNLVLVGRPGWKTQTLQAKLRKHPLLGRNLFWLSDASDEALMELYDACDGVVVGSLAEGFGLPLIEALGHGKPVLARDIAIFREIAGQNVDYFSGSSAAEVCGSLAAWIEMLEKRDEQVAKPQQLVTWNHVCHCLVQILGIPEKGAVAAVSEIGEGVGI